MFKLYISLAFWNLGHKTSSCRARQVVQAPLWLFVECHGVGCLYELEPWLLASSLVLQRAGVQASSPRSWVLLSGTSLAHFSQGDKILLYRECHITAFPSDIHVTKALDITARQALTLRPSPDDTRGLCTSWEVSLQVHSVLPGLDLSRNRIAPVGPEFILFSL